MRWGQGSSRQALAHRAFLGRPAGRPADGRPQQLTSLAGRSPHSPPSLPPQPAESPPHSAKAEQRQGIEPFWEGRERRGKKEPKLGGKIPSSILPFAHRPLFVASRDGQPPRPTMEGKNGGKKCPSFFGGVKMVKNMPSSRAQTAVLPFPLSLPS